MPHFTDKKKKFQEVNWLIQSYTGNKLHAALDNKRNVN